MLRLYGWLSGVESDAGNGALKTQSYGYVRYGTRRRPASKHLELRPALFTSLYGGGCTVSRYVNQNDRWIAAIVLFSVEKTRFTPFVA